MNLRNKLTVVPITTPEVKIVFDLLTIIDNCRELYSKSVRIYFESSTPLFENIKVLSHTTKKQLIHFLIDKFFLFERTNREESPYLYYPEEGEKLLFKYLVESVDTFYEKELIEIVDKLKTIEILERGLYWLSYFDWIRPLVNHFEKYVKENGTSPDIISALDFFIKGYHPYKVVDDFQYYISTLQRGLIEDSEILNLSNSVGQKIDSLIKNETYGLQFKAFFHHAKSEKEKSNPSKKWLLEAKNIIDSIDKNDFEREVIDLCKTSLNQIDEAHKQKLFSAFSLLDSNSEQSLRGLIWGCSFVKSNKIYDVISDLGLICLKKYAGVGALSTKIGNACIYAFSNLPEKEGMAYLVKYKNTLKLPSTLKIVEKYIAELAKKSGKSAYDLEDLACESYGLDDTHMYMQAFDACVGKIKITNHDTVIVEWSNEKGIIQKSAPSSVKADFTSDYKDFTKKTKDIQASLRIQIQRLESFYLKDRQWKYADWKDLFLCHPFMGVLTKELIWYFEGKTQKETGFWNNNEWINPNQKPIEWINDETVVRLWHPLGFEVDTVLKWRNFLSEKQLIQPFKQAFREIYLLTEAELRTENYSNRFAAHILKNYQFGALCKVRNWQGYNQFHDGGSPTLEIKHHKISASFWVEIIYEGDNAGTYTSTDQVRFYKNNQQMSLIDVPAMVFSEAMRDVDLFVGVCSIGNDPNWIDAVNRYGDYWQSYSFGEISESAKTRKVVLERLIPRLKIAKIAELTGNFLKVKGKLRTYKIHLGSGSILMEPNDQYLCIVPERAKTKDKVFLPFEGDSVLSIILSKAFLLADDDKITDVTITRQIK